MERIYSTTEPNDAEMLRLMLERDGISVHLQNTRGSMHATFLPTPATEIDVMVPEDRVEDARIILEAYLEDRTTPGDPDSIKTEEDQTWYRLKWLLLFVLWGGPALLLLPFTYPLQIINLEQWFGVVMGLGGFLLVLYLLNLILNRPTGHID